MEKYFERIEKALTAAGFKKTDVVSDEFSAAYTVQGLLASLVFLVKVIDGEEVDGKRVREIVNKGRVWCADNMKTTWIVNESGLNIILLHNGEVSAESIQSQTDKTGFQSAICQSVTAINTSHEEFKQEKTWVVLGKVRKALANLQESI